MIERDWPGFGAQKSKIFVALLGKQYGVTPPGWREAAGAYGEEGSRRSVADITGPESLADVRRFRCSQPWLDLLPVAAALGRRPELARPAAAV